MAFGDMAFGDENRGAIKVVAPLDEHRDHLSNVLKQAEDILQEARRTIGEWEPVVLACKAGLDALDMKVVHQFDHGDNPHRP